MRKSIVYHTRLDGDNRTKATGGSFGGDLDWETAERLVKSQFTVTVKPSGRAVFVDREGREVSLYISVDASQTSAGIEALARHREEQARKQAEADALAERQSAELEAATAGLTHDEILRRLRAGADTAEAGDAASAVSDRPRGG